MDNWDDLRFLVALSRTGTMTAAAKMLGTNTATVSRRIERLSETLGEPAFVKTAHGWKPSTSVARLIDLAQTFDGELQTALNSREPSEGSQQVPVNIGCPPFVTSQVLIPNMSTETETLSGIGLTFNDRLLREGLGEHDIVVQLGTPDSGRVVTRKAGSILFNMFTKRGSSAETNRWIGLSEMFDQAPVMTMGRDMFDTQRVATQAIGVIAAFLWAFPLSLLVFTLIRFMIGLRSSKEHEQMGLDCTEHNEVGYPEFQQNITFRQEP